jgi:glucose-6-phosphate 1-epimerase
LHIAKAAGKGPTKKESTTKAAYETSTEELAKKFNIPGAVEVTEVNQGRKKVILSHACGSKAEIYLFGACVTSWTQASGDEVLYIRPDAKFDGSKPISGGIPHCFPQFGPGPIQQHGFARNLEWTLASTSADLQPDERDPEATFVLEPSEYTRAMWPYDFKAVYSVSLHGEQLKTDLRILNTGDKPFEFSAALHTYLEVQDIDVAKVDGLQGLEYLDKVPDAENPVKKMQGQEHVKFTGPVDSVYLNAPDRVALDVGTGAAVEISSKGWEDVVVWNPWTSMADCYKKFCCVENAKFATPARLDAGADWRAEQTFTVIDL